MVHYRGQAQGPRENTYRKQPAKHHPISCEELPRECAMSYEASMAQRGGGAEAERQRGRRAWWVCPLRSLAERRLAGVPSELGAELAD